MSIFSQAVHEFQAGKPILQVVEDAFSQMVTWGKNLVTKAEADPVLGQVVTAAVNDGKAVLSAGLSWADTAASGELAAFSEEVAALIVKYGQRLLGSSPSVAAAATFSQALADVGQAVIAHETQALQAQLTGTLQPPGQ